MLKLRGPGKAGIEPRLGPYRTMQDSIEREKNKKYQGTLTQPLTLFSPQNYHMRQFRDIEAILLTEATPSLHTKNV